MPNFLKIFVILISFMIASFANSGAGKGNLTLEERLIQTEKDLEAGKLKIVEHKKKLKKKSSMISESQLRINENLFLEQWENTQKVKKMIIKAQ